MKKFIILILITSFVNAELLILHYSLKEKPNQIALKEVEKLQKIADKNNLKIRFEGVPWKRALLMIQLGKADGLINASFKDDRAVYAMYPMKDGKLDSTRKLNDGKTYYIFTNKKKSITWNGKTFSNVDGPVGAQENFAVVGDLKKHSNIEIVTKNKFEALLADLIRGKISALASIPEYIEKGRSELGLDKELINNLIKKEPIPIRKKDYFLIFSKQTYKDKKDEMETLWSLLKN